MSPVSFPTGPGAGRPGFPARASHCICQRPLLFRGAEECLKCGRPPKDKIASTWTDRARDIARRNKAIAAKASHRKRKRSK